MPPVLPDSSLDHILTSTRSVRRRLDLERPVDPNVVVECIELALQAPLAADHETRRFVVISDAGQRSRIGDIFARTWSELIEGPMLAGNQRLGARLDPGRAEGAEAARKGRMLEGARRLFTHMHEVPVHVLACSTDRPPRAGVGPHPSAFWGTAFPVVWSLQLALRSRGLGSCLTTSFLALDAELREVLELPDDVTPIGMLAVAHTVGLDFKPAWRRPAEELIHTDRW